MKFAIVDIETTGSHARGLGITEVAVVLTDGRQVLDRWETLVDPGMPIPEHITQLTGIDDDLVAAAPPFAAIADELESLLAECVFVAHNVGFDYAFIRGHFEALGRDWRRPKVCTVRLSRKLLPGKSSYSLGPLCEQLGIPNPARHRAMGDAAATTELFHMLWALPNGPEAIASALQRGTRESWLPQHVPASDWDALPLGPGVYRMLDARGVPLYIGMSHRVRSRVRQHFVGTPASERKQSLLRDVHRITGEATGSVLFARIMEDVLIRTHWPVHNHAQKLQPMLHVVVPYRDRSGCDRLMVRRARNARGGVAHFAGAVEAREWLFRLASEHGIAPALLSLGADGGDAQMDAQQHNARLRRALEATATHPFPEHAFCLVAGRHGEEAGVMHVHGGRFAGMGWLEGGAGESTPFEALIDCIQGAARSSMTDAVLTSAFLEPESLNEPLMWLCFGADGIRVKRS